MRVPNWTETRLLSRLSIEPSPNPPGGLYWGLAYEYRMGADRNRQGRPWIPCFAQMPRSTVAAVCPRTA